MIATAKRTVNDIGYEISHRYLETPESEKKFAAQSPKLSDSQREVVQSLKQRGIAMVSFRDLFGDGADQDWRRFEDTARAFATSERVLREAERYRTKNDGSAWKEYVVKRFEGEQNLDCSDPLLRVALSPRVLDTVNSYLGLWSRLRSTNIWYTIPSSNQRARSASQRWHRDPEDRRLVKVFLYVDAVDMTAGPLEYIPGSREGGPYAHLWPLPRGGGNQYGSYPPQDLVEETVPPNERVICTCPPATFVFCDTSGFHRGGYATEKGRLLGTWMFVTPASRARRELTATVPPGTQGFSPAAEYALS